MRTLLLTATALTLAGPVFAADLPIATKAPAMASAPAPSFNWSGCYLGGHVGAGWGHTDVSGDSFITPPGETAGVNTRAAFLGGGQIGCNAQVAPNWVLGIDGDFSWTGLRGTGDDPFFTGKNGQPFTISTRTDWLATATGRVGYSWDRWMIYGKGGAAWVRDSYSYEGIGFLFFPIDATASETRLGWTAGGGVEWAFAPAWSAKLEFDYYRFGSHTVTFTDQGIFGGVNSASLRQDFEAVKFGINYRFGGS